jgi:hypothetical protein
LPDASGRRKRRAGQALDRIAGIKISSNNIKFIKRR